MKKLLLILLYFTYLPAASSLRADAPATVPATRDAAFDALLAGIDQRGSAIQDLTADFVQEKHSALLRKPIESRGTVATRGGAALWRTTKPQPSQLAVNPLGLRIYYPDQKTIEEYDLKGSAGMLAASPLPSLKSVRENFTITPDPGENLPKPADAPHTQALLLQPANDALKKYVDHVRVLLDIDRGVLWAFELTDADGEITTIQFANIRTNVGIKDDALKIDAPPGTRVVHPLGDQGSGAP